MNSTIPQRYAKALFHLDVSKVDLKKRIHDFESILTLLNSQPKMEKFLKSPQIDLKEKKQLLNSFLGNFDSTFRHFLLLIIENERWKYLTQIALDYQLMVDRYLGIWEAEIITAVPINQQIEETVKEKLSTLFQKKIDLKKEVDSKMIGGAILVISNEIIDWSITGRLKKMKEYLLQNNSLESA